MDATMAELICSREHTCIDCPTRQLRGIQRDKAGEVVRAVHRWFEPAQIDASLLANSTQEEAILVGASPAAAQVAAAALRYQIEGNCQFYSIDVE